MFTGIVTDVGTVAAVEPLREGVGLRIDTAYDPETIAIGASISCGGVCLTVTALPDSGSNAHWFEVEAWEEVLRLTTAMGWKSGTRINLERALKIGDELGGHIVAGHADGIASIVTRDDLPDMARFELQTTRELARFIAAKGSITLDGVSLTVNEVRKAEDGSTHFAVNVIPHTAQHTTLGALTPEQHLNVEVDVLARYLDRMIAARAQ